jgi:hypothetical protein
MITRIAPRSTARDSNVVVNFTVGRVGDPFPADRLTVTSSNQVIVPSTPTDLQSPGLNIATDPDDPFQRRLTIKPVAGAVGETVITVRARDPYGHEAVQAFRVVFNAGDFTPVFDAGTDGDQLAGWQRVGTVWTQTEDANQLVRLGAGAYMQRKVTGLVPGQTYELAGLLQAWRDQNNDAMWLGVKDHGGSPLAASVVHGGLFEPATVRFVPTGTTATVFVANTSTNGVADEVQADMLTLLPAAGGTVRRARSGPGTDPRALDRGGHAGGHRDQAGRERHPRNPHQQQRRAVPPWQPGRDR